MFTPGERVRIDAEPTIVEELLKHFHDPPLDTGSTQSGPGQGKKSAVHGKFLKVVDDLAKQLGPDAPPREAKDWWEQFDKENLPVRREHFKEFKAAKEDNEQMLRMFLLSAGKKQHEAAMEARLWKKKFNDQVKDAGVMDRAKVNAMIKGLRDKKRLSEPIYSIDDTQREENTEKVHFLWDNLNDNIQQTHVETLLARARCMWVLRDWSTMLTRSEEAIAMAKELDYPPLDARCQFYLGVAEYGSRNFSQAYASFEKASACIGKYWEGSQLEGWRVKANKAMKESPPLSEESGSSGLPFSLSPASPSKQGRWKGQPGPHGGEFLGGFPGSGDDSESDEGEPIDDTHGNHNDGSSEVPV